MIIRIRKILILLALVSSFAFAEADSKSPAMSTIPKVLKCDQCSTESKSLTGNCETEWIANDKRAASSLSLQQFTDQDGKKWKWNDLITRPTAISFIYTRCSNPNKCPLTASTMAKLQQMVRREKLDSKVRLCVVTYDAEYDEPRILKAYAKQFGFLCDEDFILLRPDVEKKDDLFKSLNVSVNYDSSRVNIHGLQLILLDRSGRVAKSYHSLIWDNNKVLGDLKKLCSEE